MWGGEKKMKKEEKVSKSDEFGHFYPKKEVQKHEKTTPKRRKMTPPRLRPLRKFPRISYLLLVTMFLDPPPKTRNPTPF